MTITEIKDVRQRPEEGFRRWYCNDYFDIIIWYESKDGPLKGFQVCYAKGFDEKEFTWEPSKVSSHFVTDRGTGNFYKSTGFLKGHAGAIPETVVDNLRRDRGELPDDFFSFMIGKISEYNERAASA